MTFISPAPPKAPANTNSRICSAFIPMFLK
jgi:hypothetical protein